MENPQDKTGSSAETEKKSFPISKAVSNNGAEQVFRKDPLRVEVVKDDELTSFEKKTVGLGYWGIVISACSFLAACLAAFLVYQQFKEMSSQTELLSRAARQARKDSQDSSTATAKQLAAVQAQITIAQDGTHAIQGQLKEARRLAEIASQQLDASDRAWVDLQVTVNGPVSFNANGMVIPFKVDATNFGHSPALNVDIRASITNANFFDPVSFQKNSAPLEKD